jgi:GT2 family glycosyltransferase
MIEEQTKTWESCMPVELAIITNSFNRRDLFEKAAATLLPALESWQGRVTWVVFEAGSTDGSPDWVRQLAGEQPELNIQLIEPQPPAASSFADGCNQAIAHALAQHPNLKWCLFYETDNQLHNPKALNLAVQLLEQQPRLGGTGFTVERLHGGKTGYGCRFPRLLSFALGQQVSARWRLDEPPEPAWQTGPEGRRWALCDVVYTSPLLIRAEAWREAGPMDATAFPFTDSDVEWCWRAHQGGWPIAVLDVPGVIHDNGGSVSNWSGRRVLWFHQSRMRLLCRLFPVRANLLKPLLLLRHLLELSWLYTQSKKSKQANQSMQTRLKLIQSVFVSYEDVLK